MEKREYRNNINEKRDMGKTLKKSKKNKKVRRKGVIDDAAGMSTCSAHAGGSTPPVLSTSTLIHKKVTNLSAPPTVGVTITETEAV